MVILWRWSVECRENGYVAEVITLMEGKWSGYRWPVYWKENGHATEVVS